MGNRSPAACGWVVDVCHLGEGWKLVHTRSARSVLFARAHSQEWLCHRAMAYISAMPDFATFPPRRPFHRLLRPACLALFVSLGAFLAAGSPRQASPLQKADTTGQ